MNLENILNKIKKETVEIKPFLPKLNISIEDFNTLILAICEKNLRLRNKENYIIDDNNKEVLKQLRFYLTKDEQFNGDFNKGILFIGKIGSGKTILMQSFIELIENVYNKVFIKISSIELVNNIQKEGFAEYIKKPLYVDDLGKEPTQIKNYGTLESPINNLFQLRYNYNSITFATSNFNLESIEKLYSKAVADRFKEMFNILILTGDSKR